MKTESDSTFANEDPYKGLPDITLTRDQHASWIKNEYIMHHLFCMLLDYKKEHGTDHPAKDLIFNEGKKLVEIQKQYGSNPMGYRNMTPEEWAFKELNEKEILLLIQIRDSETASTQEKEIAQIDINRRNLISRLIKFKNPVIDQVL